jgi:phosphoserine phosphatase RsbU/P
MPNFAPKFSLRAWTSPPRPFLFSLAALFSAATILFAFAWMYSVRRLPYTVEIGFNQKHVTSFDPASSSIPVLDLVPGSPAEHAGLRVGDQIIAINGQNLTSYAPFGRVWSNAHPGDSVDITVRRPGAPQPVRLQAFFRLAATDTPPEGLARASARHLTSFYPVFFLLVGFSVLFLRLDDVNAWLLALLFACFVGAPTLGDTSLLPRAVVIFMGTYRAIFLGLITSVFYVFFAVFPERSPLERRAPWLKWLALAIGVSQVLPGLADGNPRWPVFVEDRIGVAASNDLRHALTYGTIVLGLVSLVSNYLGKQTSAESRRKSRVLLWGTFLGVLPIISEKILVDLFGFAPSFWVDITLTLLLLLYPLSFAYAVVKHRVLEIPALLRRSARYVLVQRGFFLLLLCGALFAIFLFTRFFSGYFTQNSQFGMALSAVFGVVLVWVSGPIVKRGTDRIDRAFFRSSYDARIILQDLAEKARTVSDRHELASLLELYIEGALHPQSLAFYLERDGHLVVEHSAVSGVLRPAPPRSMFPFRFGARFVLREADTLPATLPLLDELARHGKAWDVPPAVSCDAGTGKISSLAPECLVPILGRNSQLIGLLVLGGRRSEEPYSGEDKYLLDSVARQAAASLENMRLAELMADRLEQDRRAAHEMQIAREVQSRLFPQALPALTTLDYAGHCIQARQVGGDYYDFLDLGSSQRLDRGATRALEAAAWHLALLLADISGKGIAAALLMANLQANLRSRYALALDDLPRLLKSVNQLFYENTPDDRYATLFFAVYDDHSRELEYANCGHNPPLLFRADGSVESLASTSTVIGLFTEWHCATRHITLAPGDLLVIYTDGVTEAADASGNEFGEARIVETVRAHFQDPPQQLLLRIQEAVQKFSAGEQFDDLTLVVARCR